MEIYAKQPGDDSEGIYVESKIKALMFQPSPKLKEIFKETSLLEIIDGSCGVAPFQLKLDPNVNQLSFGAENVRHIEYPWMASIYIQTKYKCTLNLVSKNIGVTAAHCFTDNFPKEDIRVELFNNQSKAYQ